LEFLLISPLKREFLSIAGADAYGEDEMEAVSLARQWTVV